MPSPLWICGLPNTAPSSSRARTAATLSSSGNPRTCFSTSGLKTSDFFKGFFLVFWHRDQTTRSPQPLNFHRDAFVKFFKLVATGAVFSPRVISRFDLDRPQRDAGCAIDNCHIVAV